jgi:hypothetical protein
VGSETDLLNKAERLCCCGDIDSPWPGKDMTRLLSAVRMVGGLGEGCQAMLEAGSQVWRSLKSSGCPLRLCGYHSDQLSWFTWNGEDFQDLRISLYKTRKVPSKTKTSWSTDWHWLN